MVAQRLALSALDLAASDHPGLRSAVLHLASVGCDDCVTLVAVLNFLFGPCVNQCHNENRQSPFCVPVQHDGSGNQ